ncbi:hypothetical protein FWK35_00004661 [Aphis craccivora]|uniref:Uncharacterized protein n=1 Tax=Aphis craccivora TaxID=307492 RepID=A0A6G0Z4D1_APHCR|nr:hypothetical protein FWK35_00004661 [Aphis craccivora]
MIIIIEFKFDTPMIYNNDPHGSLIVQQSGTHLPVFFTMNLFTLFYGMSRNLINNINIYHLKIINIINVSNKV